MGLAASRYFGRVSLLGLWRQRSCRAIYGPVPGAPDPRRRADLGAARRSLAAIAGDHGHSAEDVGLALFPDRWLWSANGRGDVDFLRRADPSGQRVLDLWRKAERICLEKRVWGRGKEWVGAD